MNIETPKTKLIAAAVYDSKVRQHLAPNFFRTTEEAIRAFGSAAKKEGHDFSEFAHDYTLWAIGTFCPETGEIEYTSRHQIASASEFSTKSS